MKNMKNQKKTNKEHMNISCKFSKDNYDYINELSLLEYQEVLDLKIEIKNKKNQLSQLLHMYEKLEPSRVHKIQKQILLDDILH